MFLITLADAARTLLGLKSASMEYVAASVDVPARTADVVGRVGEESAVAHRHRSAYAIVEDPAAVALGRVAGQDALADRYSPRTAVVDAAAIGIRGVAAKQA